MKKKIKTVASILLSFVLLLSVFPAAFATPPETPALQVTITPDKTGYGVSDLAEIEVIVKNISTEALTDVNVTNIFTDTSILVLSKDASTIDTLAPDKEITMTLWVCSIDSFNTILDGNFSSLMLGLNIFFKVLGGNNIVTGQTAAAADDFTKAFDTAKDIKFGDKTATQTVHVTYANTAASVGTKAQIVAAYKTAANKTKAFTGKVNITRIDSVAGEINALGGKLATNVAKYLLKTTDLTAVVNDAGFLSFNNGDSGSVNIKDFLPRMGETEMCTLDPAGTGVKYAMCIPDGTGGFKYKITLNDESVDKLTAVPTYHGQCMDTLGAPVIKELLDNIDVGDYASMITQIEAMKIPGSLSVKLSELGLTDAVVNGWISQIDKAGLSGFGLDKALKKLVAGSADLNLSTLKYTDDSTITATVNTAGFLTKLNIVEPVNLTGKVSFNLFSGLKFDLTGTWKQAFTFGYPAA